MPREPRDTLILCLKQPARGGYALWWGPDRRGYYAELEAAGRYTRSEAEEICAGIEYNATPAPLQTAMIQACTVVDLARIPDYWQRRLVKGKEQG